MRRRIEANGTRVLQRPVPAGQPRSHARFPGVGLLDNFTIPVLRPFIGGRRYVSGQQPGRTYIRAAVNQKDVGRWYEDNRRDGQMAFIASHYGQERAQMINSLHAARDDNPISKLLQKGMADMLSSNRPIEDYKAEYKNFLDNSDLPSDVVQGFKKMARLS